MLGEAEEAREVVRGVTEIFGEFNVSDFIWLFKNCFQSLGRAMEKNRGDTQNNRQNEALLWGLGSALFSHAINLTASNYFDQFWVMWIMLLAIISSAVQNFIHGYKKSTLIKVKTDQSIPSMI